MPPPHVPANILQLFEPQFFLCNTNLFLLWLCPSDCSSSRISWPVQIEYLRKPIMSHAALSQWCTRSKPFAPSFDFMIKFYLTSSQRLLFQFPWNRPTPREPLKYLLPSNFQCALFCFKGCDEIHPEHLLTFILAQCQHFLAPRNINQCTLLSDLLTDILQNCFQD